MGNRYQPLDLLGGFYDDETKPWTVQDCVNYLPVLGEVPGTRTPMKLKGAPGFYLFAEVGEGPFRGARNVGEKLFVVSGNTLYEVFTDGTSTSRGTIPGTGRVSMSHNQIEFGNELTVVNGDAGYVWNTVTSTFTKITDDGFEGSMQVDYIDHRMIHVDPFGRFAFNSALDDALSFNSLDRFDSEASPDKMVGVGVNALEVVIFNKDTTEFFADTGASPQPFRAKRIAIDTGCASRNSIVKLENALMWLGHDGLFYRLNGYSAAPISTGPMASAVADLDWEDCFGFTWEDKKFKVAYWTFPDGHTWGFDLVSGLWHRRQSFGMDRWRINTMTKWNGAWYAGDMTNGNLYRISWTTYHENGEELIAERISSPSSNNQNRVVNPYIEFMFDVGGEVASDTPIIAGDVPNWAQGIPLVPVFYTTSGGVAPYSNYVISSGSLPTGLTLNPTTGEVTGTPTVLGPFSWTIQRTDSLGVIASHNDSAVIATIFTPVPDLWMKSDVATNSMTPHLSGDRFQAWESSEGLGVDFTPTAAGTSFGPLAVTRNGMRWAYFDGVNAKIRGQAPDIRDFLNGVSGGSIFGVSAMAVADAGAGTRRAIMHFEVEPPGSNLNPRLGLYVSFDGGLANRPGIRGFRIQSASPPAQSFSGVNQGVSGYVAGGVVNYLMGTADTYVNGSLDNSGLDQTSSSLGAVVNVTPTGSPTIGGSATGLNCDTYVGEIIVYKSAIDATLRQKVEGYLAWKWNGSDYPLVGQLPMSHPYKNAPPLSL